MFILNRWDQFIGNSKYSPLPGRSQGAKATAMFNKHPVKKVCPLGSILGAHYCKGSEVILRLGTARDLGFVGNFPALGKEQRRNFLTAQEQGLVKGRGRGR